MNVQSPVTNDRYMQRETTKAMWNRLPHYWRDLVIVTYFIYTSIHQ